MKEVEMRLQLLRNKRQRKTIEAYGNHGDIALLSCLNDRKPHAHVNLVDNAHLTPQGISGCYSLEQEFASSISLPR